MVDGWGNLITPYGTFQTIRIKSQWVENDSVYLDSLGLGFPIVRNVTEYKWMGKNQGEPLLQITEEGLMKTAMYRDIINHAGFSEIRKESVTVYPNPTKGSFCLNLNCPDQPARLLLLTIQGKMIKEEDVRFTSGKTGLIDLEDLPVGFYILQVIHDKEIFTGKLFLERE